MRTTLDIDEKLIEEVVAITKEKNRGKAVNKALAEYIRRRRREELRAMLGRLDLELDDWYEFRHTER